jgi:hypothetical protein
MQDAEYPAESQVTEWRGRLGGSPSFVYVVQGEPGTPIKVGVAKDPMARLRGLQTGNPQRLRILCVIPGDHALETALHDRLRDSRVLGEWFGEPGIDEFLVWVEGYATRAVQVFERSGHLPAVPPTRRIYRKGFGPYRDHGPQVGHRWRTSTGTRQNPLTVRFVEPDPPTPDEIAERKRQRDHEREMARKLYRRVDPDEWYPGKEDAA